MLSEAQIEAELGSLLKVDITAPRWAETGLLDLDYVQRTAEELKLAPSDSRYAIGVAILQAVTVCIVPNGPHSPIDAWRDAVAAELNLVAAIRKTVVAVLASRSDSTSARAIVEAISGDKFSPAKLNAEDLSLAARQQMVAAALRNFRVWKNWEPLDSKDDEDWKPIIVALSQRGALSRDIIYESRDQLRHKVASFLHSNKTPSFSPGFIAVWKPEQSTRPTARITSQSDSTPSPEPVQPSVPPPSLSERETVVDDNPTEIEKGEARFEAVNAWLKKQTASGLSHRARQLARVMAAFTLEIERGPEPTPRLTRLNVDRALRWIRIEPADSNLGDELIGQLIDKQIVRRERYTLEFTRADRQYFLAAEFVAQPDCIWASLQPRFRTIIHWAARLLAPQQDDYLNQRFLDRLLVGQKLASPSVWLDIADCLVVFREHRTPCVDRHITNVEALLIGLHENGLRHFRLAAFERLARLKGNEGFGGADTHPAPISDLALENLRRQYNLPNLLLQIGFTPKEPQSEWLHSRIVLSRLINEFRADKSVWRPACAAWLRVAALNTIIGPNSLSNVLAGNVLISAREVLAQIAMDKDVDTPTKELVTTALVSDESLLHLSELSTQYLPVIIELEIITGRRLWRRRGSDDWELIDYSQPSPF